MQCFLPQHGVNCQQRAEIEARDQLARTIATNVELDAQGRFDQQWRTRLMSTLYGVPSAKLRDIAAQARTLDQAQKMGGNAYQSRKSLSIGGPKALGDDTADLVFTPMTPCRFIDTRNVGGVIPKGGAAFTAFDTFYEGSLYGGDSSCTLPGAGRIAIAANITVVVVSGAAGFLGIRPYNSTTRSSLVNWPAGGTTGIANAAIITTAINASTHYAFEAYAGGNTPYLVVDYFGYFEPVTTIVPDCVETSTQQFTTSAVIGESSVYMGNICPDGYTLSAPYCVAVYPLVFEGAEAPGPSCFFYNPTTSTQHAEYGARCCRIP